MGRSPRAPVPSWGSLESGLGTHCSVHWGARGSGESSLQHTGRRELEGLERPCQAFVFQETVWQDTEVGSRFLTLLYLHTGIYGSVLLTPALLADRELFILPGHGYSGNKELCPI